MMIATRWLALAALVAGLPLGGCALLNDNSPCYGQSLPALMDAGNLQQVFAEIARELCQPACAGDCRGERAACGAEVSTRPVMVSDFANLDTYVPGQAGLLMGEMMRSALSTGCCRKIVQAEYGKFFKLSEQGLVILTRKVDEIRRDDFPGQDIVVGTYSFHGSKLSIFARRIDSRTGIVERMVTREITYSCNGSRISVHAD
jgi:hypothetical protein